MIRKFPSGSNWAILLILATGSTPAGGARGAEIVRGPYLQALLDTKVDILWKTDAPALGGVEFWREGDLPQRLEDSAPSVDHHLSVTGLLPGSVVHYQVLEGGSPRSGPYRFRTSPPPGGEAFRVAVIGDSGSADSSQEEVAGRIEEMAPDLFLHTGDLVYTGTVDDAIFNPYRQILHGAGFFPSKGNHDDLAHGLDWCSVLVPPMENPEKTCTYYSFDWGSAHFVALDVTHGFEAGSLQLDWLVKDLEAARAAGRDWIIVYLHYPPYTVGTYAFLDSRDPGHPRQLISPIADRFGVDLVLAGHDHNYQRTYPVRGEVVRDAWQDPDFISPGGTIYVVTGGGGGGLYAESLQADHRFTARFRSAHHAVELTIAASRISVRAVSAEKEVLDAFSIAKGEPPRFGFVRGDADLSGTLDITDPVRILGYLFLGVPLDCPDAAALLADANGSSQPPSISDAIYLLQYLFLEGPPPPPPFPACESLPRQDDAFCRTTGCPRQ